MFDSLVGNSRVKEILRRMLRRNRVPNSMLFAGENGVGKKTFAVYLAKSLLCKTPVNSESCDICSACKRANTILETAKVSQSQDAETFKRVIFGDHPDLGMILPFKKQILIEAIRDLEERANNVKPFEANSRIFIIDEAEKMNDTSANALLKVLEEPPIGIYIFLISSQPSLLPLTILSRVQMIRFTPLQTEEIITFLREKKGMTGSEAVAVATYADGSISKALSLNKLQFLSIRKQALEVINQVLADESDFSKLLLVSEEISDPKTDYQFFLKTLQQLIRDVWILSLGGDNIVNADIKEELMSLAKKANSSIFSRWLQEIEKLLQYLDLNLNKKIATDALLLEMKSMQLSLKTAWK
jgi:DNA polymerase-3 subunit delta'